MTLEHITRKAGNYHPANLEEALEVALASVASEAAGAGPLPIVPTTGMLADICDRILRLEQIITEHA